MKPLEELGRPAESDSRVPSSRRHHCGRRGRQGGEGAPLSVEGSSSPSWAHVKALLVQSAVALWIGTRGGYLLLLELSKHQTLQVIGPLCDSIRCVSSALIGGSRTATLDLFSLYFNLFRPDILISVPRLSWPCLVLNLVTCFCICKTVAEMLRGSFETCILSVLKQ